MSYLGNTVDSSAVQRTAYTVKSTNYTVSPNEGVIADTAGGAFTITLPAAPATGTEVFIADKGSWSTNNLTVGRNGQTIEGVAQDLVMDVSGASVQFIYDGFTWNVYAQVGTVSGTTAGGFNITSVKTANYTAAGGELVRVNSTSGAFTVTLPSGAVDGDRISVVDVANKCGTNAVLVAVSGGKTVEGDSTGLSLNIDGAAIELLYNISTTNWKLVSSSGARNTAILQQLSGGTGGTSLKTIGGASIVGTGDIATMPGLVIVSATTQTAVASAHYALTNVAATTVTLPASPTAGDIVWVTPCNGLATNVIARNGSNIMSLAEDLTIADKNMTIALRYINSTVGWRFV